MSKAIYMKVTHENQMTGLRTFELSREAYLVVSTWVREEHGEELIDVARSGRFNKRGNFTFKCGVGYAVVDADLLGGTGDGRTENKFNYVTGCYLRAPNSMRDIPAIVKRNW